MRLLFEVLVEIGRLDDAIVLGQQLLGVEDHDDDVRLMLARIHAAAGRWQAAGDLAAPLAESDRAAATILRRARWETGREEQGQGSGRRSRSLHSVDRSHQELGRLYFAEQLLEWAEGTRSSIARDAVIARLKAGRYTELHYSIALWIRELDDSAQRCIASVDWHLLKGDVGAALQLLEGHVSDGSLGAPGWNRLGDCALATNDLARARAAYRKSVVADPGHANTWLDLARVEFLLGNSEAAEAAAQRAVSSARSNGDRRRALATLQQLKREPTGLRRAGLYGLVWHDGGGATLEIEVEITDAPGLTISGNVGGAMEEAARVAWTLIKLHEAKGGELGVHVHFPEFRVYKDGGSAGLLIACALAQRLRGRNVEHRLGLTGELTLGGRVIPIGGLREKLIAGHLAGLDRVLIPAGNEADLIRVPGSVKRDLEIHMVSSFEEAWLLL